MEMAGAMRLENFWTQTPREFSARWRGFEVTRGVKRGGKVKPPTRAEFEDWKAKEARGEKF